MGTGKLNNIDYVSSQAISGGTYIGNIITTTGGISSATGIYADWISGNNSNLVGTDTSWSGASEFYAVSGIVNTLDAWYDASAQKLSASGALAHNRVTLAGTPNYLTISDQEITRSKLDLNDDTNFTEGTGIDLTTNTVSVLGYATISSNAKKGYISGASLGDLAYRNTYSITGSSDITWVSTDFNNSGLKWDDLTQKWLAMPSSSAGGRLSDIVEDTTPQLGGDLEGNTYGINNVTYISSAGNISGQWITPLYVGKPTASNHPGEIIRTSGNANGTWVWISVYNGSAYEWVQIAMST